MKHLVIIGAGGHGKVVADCATQLNRFLSIRFLDGKDGLTSVNDWPVVGTPDTFHQFINSDTVFFVAIGGNAIRKHWQQTLSNAGAEMATLVHPHASIGMNVELGKGTLVLAQAAINIDAVIGEGCIVNTGATVDHDCQIGDFVHVAPGCHLAGTVTLKDQVFSGVGSKVLPNLTIGENTIIGAGATVTTNAQKGVTLVGTPAKTIEKK